MSFAAPLFLLAALAGLIPVLLHLIHRRRAKEIPFSTLRFLKLSVQRTRRRKYVEDLSLLVLRVLVLLLIAIGLARPAITGLASLWGSGAAAIAIVLDNSASMGTIDGGRPRFEAARQAAKMVLSGLREGEEAALILTGGPPGPELGRLVRTHETLRQALDQCRVSFERTDLAARLQQARDLLSQADASNKEIYIITDNQNVSWDGLKEAGSSEQDRPTKSPPAVPVVLVNVDHEPVPNVAIQSISLSTPAPVAGAAHVAEAEILNTSTVPQQKHLELRIDGTRQAVSPTLTLAAGGSARYAFRFALDREGVHRGEVRLVEEDGLAPDNQLYFAAVADQQIPVAILKPRRDEVPQADDAFYLERALAPGGAVGSAFRLTTLTPDSLAAEDLSNQALVFCVNLPALSPPAAERLLAYVRGGGRVFWICGQNVRPVAYNAMNALAQGQLLPATLEEPRQPLPGGVEGWHFGFLDKEDRALAALTEPASLYQTVLVTKHFPLSVGGPSGRSSVGSAVRTIPNGSVDGPHSGPYGSFSPQSGTHALIKLDDGQTLLAERTVGAGSVLLLGAALHPDWTNLPLKPLFLPLVARLTFRLAGRDAERTMVTAGSPVSRKLGHASSKPGSPEPKQGGEVEIVRPSGEIVRTTKGLEADGLFHYADTHEAGIYLVRPLADRRSKTFAFAANIDPAESDATVVTPQELQVRFGAAPLLSCEGPEEMAPAIARLREGTSLRDLFLTAVLAALVLEVFLANRRAAQAPAPTAFVAPVPADASTSVARAGG